MYLRLHTHVYSAWSVILCASLCWQADVVGVAWPAKPVPSNRFKWDGLAGQTICTVVCFVVHCS